MRRELLTFRDPKSPVSEIFRTLRTNIQFMNTDKKLKTLLVTSTFPGEGKSWVTSNLAVTFAQAGKKVILIDADMRKGRQFSIFGTTPKPGLSNYLSSMDADNIETTSINISSCIHKTDVDNLSLVPAGNVPPNPSELLVSSRMKELLKELKEMYDLIIIDGTPCDLVTDSIILSRFVDSTVIVTAQKETKKDSLARIVKNIQNVGGKIAGVVVNKMDISAKKYNQSYYYGSISGGNGNTKHSHNYQKSKEFVPKYFDFDHDDDDDEYDNELDDTPKTFTSSNAEKPKGFAFEVAEAPEKFIEKIKEIELDTEEETIEETVQANTQLEETSQVNINQNKSQNKNKRRKENNKKVSNNENINFTEQTLQTVEKAESAKDIPDEKANEIINIVNDYVKTEQERKN